MITDASFRAIADHALMVNFAATMDTDASRAVAALDKAIMAGPPHGVIETVPALVNLLVSFDPLLTDHDLLAADIRKKLRHPEPAPSQGQVRPVQVCFDDDLGPDMNAVADACNMSSEAVISAFLAGDYRVLMYGFAPGYAYLGGVAPDIQVPRKPTPLRDVPTGSVVIANGQCLVTTLTMPTGWSIIGRSPTRILTGETDRPFLFEIGDAVRFERIDRATFEQARSEVVDA